MGKKGVYQVIHAPNLLRAKIIGDLAYDETAVARADAALEKLKDSYTEWLDKDLAALMDALDAIKADPAHAEPHLDAMLKLTHEVKGQAGTFGYQLITSIAKSLNDTLRKLDRLEQRHLELIEAHVDAMKVAVREEFQGDAGDLGRELLDHLNTAVTSVVR